MSGDSVDPQQGKNFRTSYYENLLFRGEEEETSAGRLESLLEAENIDVEGLKQFCQSHTLPPYHRLQVWNIILDVVPPYNDVETCTHVRRQREQQFLDLRRALCVLLSETPPLHHSASHSKVAPNHKQKRLTPEQLVLMYLLQVNQLPVSASISGIRVQYRDSIPLARAFLDFCEAERDAYWLFVRFSRLLDTIDRDLLKSSCFLYVEKEDSALCAHLRSLEDGIPFSPWFNQCFASALPEYCLERVWDRLIGGCVMVLVFLAVAILLTFKRRLLGAKTTATVSEVLIEIPEENCILIVMKAVELWEANSSLLLPIPPASHGGHSND